MKKFYLLMMFALLGMVANAAEVTFVFSQMGFTDKQDVTTITSNDGSVVLTFDKGSNNNTPKYYDNGTSIRVYGGSTMTVASTNGQNITNIAFELSGNDIVASTGSYSTSTWTGSASEVTFTTSGTSGHTKYVSLTVTLGEVVEPTQVAAPTFSVAEGSYVDAQSIALYCATADASIFYTINNGAETAYEAPIELSENGEYVIKAWAKKEGLKDSEVVTKTYTINIFDGLIEDFDFVTIGQTNGYPTDVNTAEGGTPTFTSGIVTVSTIQTGNTPNRFWSDWKEYRMYKGATLTFSVPASYAIVKIELTPTNSPVEGEGYVNGVWNGEQSSVSLNITGSAKFTDFVVYYKQVAADQVLAPTFSLTSGTYEGTQSLALNCETEGATIYYTVNGGETQTYANDAIELTEGEYAFVAWAEKDGMTKSSEVTANYTIVAPLVANSIAEFLALGAENTDRVITLNCDLTVLFQGGGEGTRDLYVKDATGKGLFIYEYNNPQFNKGDVIDGVKGKYKDFNGTIEMVSPVYGVVKETVEVAPVSVDASQLTVDNVNEYVVVNNVELSEVNGADATLNDETATLALYNKYNACTYPKDLNKKYFVTGIVSVFNNEVQIYPLEITIDTESGVNDAVANEFKAVAVANGIEVNVAEAGLVSVYNAAGQLVANVNVAEGATTINVAGGFYIVKAGNNVAKVLVK